MLQLQDNETIILVVHKHWFVLARVVILFVVLLLIPPVVLTFLPYASAQFDPAFVEPVTNFLLSLYIMVLLVFLFLFWMEYYLNMWIITTLRIIDVDQRGLFSREIAEIPLTRVQDVTIDVQGIFETFLKFGTIRIQTAGEREFTMTEIPQLYEVKDAIVKYASAGTQGPLLQTPKKPKGRENPSEHTEDLLQ